MGQVTLEELAAPVPSLLHVLTPPQVAKLLGWSRRRTFRFLRLANAKMGGRLLLDANPGGKRPRWTVAVSALKEVAGQWFIADMQIELEFMRKRGEERQATTEDLQAEIRVLKEQVRMLLDKVSGKS